MFSKEVSGHNTPVGFHFKVSFLQEVSNDIDTRFQSVSGLNVTLETENFAEGGENRFVHSLPVRTKFDNLVLKRGIILDHDLVKWVKDAVENFEFRPLNMQVVLLNDDNEPLNVWDIVNAYPVKWSVSDFNAEESKLVIETLELKYQYFKTSKPN
jgi:phage tail-like protein